MIVARYFLTLPKYFPLSSFSFKTLSAVASFGVVLTLLLQSCAKGTNIVPSSGSWNFSITGAAANGSYYVGDTLKFISTAGDNSIFSWTFGDGNSSLRPTPSFVYYSIAHDTLGNIVSDTVTLVVNNDVYHSVVKTITLKPPVPRICKTWTWTGGYFKKYGTCCPSISDQPLSDTTFAINKINDYTIDVLGTSLPFLADSNYFSNTKAAGFFDATYVIYTGDTLFYHQRTGTDSGGYDVTYFHKF